MAATGEFTESWAGSDIDPYVSSGMDNINIEGKLLGGGLCASQSYGGPCKYVYAGEVDRSQTLYARIELLKVSGDWYDYVGPAMTDPVTGAGYWFKIHGSECWIAKQSSETDTGVVLGSKATGQSFADGDIFEMSMSPAGLLVCKQGEATIISRTDTTYLSTVKPAAQAGWDNTNSLRMASFGADGIASDAISLGTVNGNNEIVSNGPISIECVNAELVTGVTYGGDALSIEFNASGIVRCTPIDMHDTALTPDTSFDLIVTDGTDSPSVSVLMKSEAGMEWIAATSIDATYGLLHSCVGAKIGDLYEGPDYMGGGSSDATYEAAGPHRNIYPATANGTTSTGWWYNGTVWEEIDETTNRESGNAGVPPSWTSALAPPNAIMGESYRWDFSAQLAGDRPMTCTLVGSAPAGIDIGTGADAEVLLGTATESGAFTGLTIRAENGV